MSFLYEREEDKEKVIFRHKTLNYYFYFAMCLLASGAILVSWESKEACFCVVPVIVFLLLAAIWFLDREIISEIREAKNNGKLKSSGSKFSFSNPLVLEVTKGD